MVLLTTKHMQSPGLKIEILRDRLLLRKKVLFNMDRKFSSRGPAFFTSEYLPDVSSDIVHSDFNQIRIFTVI